jgi:hypothetical protein
VKKAAGGGIEPVSNGSSRRPARARPRRSEGLFMRARHEMSSAGLRSRGDAGRRSVGRRAAVVAVAAAWIATGSGVTTQQQFQLFASIVDASGAPPAAVEPSDIRVMENGVEARIVKVEPVSFPVKLQLLLDNGVGLGSENFQHLVNGARGLIEALPPDIEVTLVATAGRPRVLVRSTTDHAALVKGIALLIPEGGAGRFVEALSEATERIEKDKGDYVAVIVSVATTAGDLIVLERDVERLSKRLQSHPTIVHVVLVSLLGSRTARGGANQVDVGIGATEMTGGRFETIAAPNRLATLLPEMGAQVATTHTRQSRQFKVTAQRPAGASGDLKGVTMAAFGGLSVTAVSFDGRVLD